MHSRISIPIDAVLGELQVVHCCAIPMSYFVADVRNRLSFEGTKSKYPLLVNFWSV